MNSNRLQNFRDGAQVYQDRLEERYKNYFINKDIEYRKRLKNSKKKLPSLEVVLKIRTAMFVIAGCSLIPSVYVCLFYYPMQFMEEVGTVLIWIQVGGFLFFLFGIAVENEIVKRFERDDVCWVFKSFPHI